MLTSFLGAEPFLIHQQSDSFTTFNLQMYEDKSAHLSFSEIENIQTFTPHSNDISTGYSDSTFWFKFTLENLSGKRTRHLVKLSESNMHKVNFYTVSNKGKKGYEEYGVSYYKKGVKNIHKNAKFTVDLDVNETKVVYISVFSRYANSFNISIFNERDLNAYELKYHNFYSAYFGALIALLLYNLVIFFFNKQRVYLYYVLYVGFFLLWHLLYNAFYPFNSYTSTEAFYSSGAVIPLMLGFFLLFSRSLLETKKLLPKIDKAILFFAYLSMTLALTSQFFFQASFMVLNATATFFIPFLIYIGFRSYRLGNKTALFYIIAQMIFLSTSFIFSLMTEGFLQYSLLARHGVVVGSMIEIILFALALAYKIKLLEQDRVKLINQAKEELEAKVQERTYELQHEKKRVEDALAFRSKFLSNMSHELRTPLNGVLGLTQAVLKTDLNEKQREMLNQVNISSDILLGIINDILDLSKIEAGKMHIEKAPLNIKVLMDTLVNLFALKVKEKNIVLEVEYKNMDNANYLGDALRISQIMNNLISNAIKFTEEGGVYIVITALRNGHVEFEVKDTGIGMKEEHLDVLFDEFTQAEMDTSRRFGGTGLGLSISKNLVALMKGKIWVKSSYKEGSIFSVELPLQKNSKVQEAHDAALDETILFALINRIKDIKILVAEDNEVNQMVLKLLLADTPLNLDFAQNGELAIEMYENGDYDMILMDIQMPIMNGYDATKAIREKDTNIPIIALSANVVEEDIQKAYVCGVNDYLHKPIDLVKLYEMLLKYLK